MAVEQIRTFVRPNTSVEFKETVFSEEITTLTDNIYNSFLANATLIVSKSISEDELTLTTTETFANIQIFLGYHQAHDTTLLANNFSLTNTVFSIKHQYFHDNGITFAQTRNFNA